MKERDVGPASQWGRIPEGRERRVMGMQIDGGGGERESGVMSDVEFVTHEQPQRTPGSW